MAPKKIFIIAGEPSGDIHGANLVKNLKKLIPECLFSGLGGKLMKDAGVNIYYDTNIAVVGVSEVLHHISEIKKIFKGLAAKLDEEKFDLVILIDFPGFNLRFSKEVKKRNIPLVYYISPQVWAWGKYRLRTIKKNVDKMIVFFKFEEDLYKKYGINVEFVGHPLIELAKATTPKNDWLKINNLAPGKITISLLPGSRKSVYEKLLPIMLEASKLIKKELPQTQFIIIKFPDIPKQIFENFIKDHNIDAKIIEGDLYNALNASDFAIGASGTSSLEATIMGVPMAITYKFSDISYILIKLAARVPFIGLANIIAGRKIVEEFIQWDALPENIAKYASDALKNPEKINSIKNELSKVKLSLGDSGANKRAAEAVTDFINKISQQSTVNSR